ncbi:hypothetical protein DYB32_002881 [Aphanomyces invadans]|uniref:WW domain-containing protein n=1 Tax=Aphanomyces invadans TaxID=157072 RepID=A0A3R6VE16_9STRA|nr:hypothetical protein DYB32_002881 [Aphanomyces invadans]
MAMYGTQQPDSGTLATTESVSYSYQQTYDDTAYASQSYAHYQQSWDPYAPGAGDDLLCASPIDPPQGNDELDYAQYSYDPGQGYTNDEHQGYELQDGYQAYYDSYDQAYDQQSYSYQPDNMEPYDRTDAYAEDPAAPVDSDWQEAHDPASGLVYYYNSRTGESVWQT